MCFSLICGATFALFTSEDKVNIAVTSGTVKIAAQIKDFEMHSRDVDCTASGIFVNTGTAEIDGNEITLERMTPGDGVSFKIDVQNYSNVSAKYRVLIDVMEDTGLVEALNVSFKDASNNEISLLAGSGFTAWTEIVGADAYATNPDVVNTINVSIEFPYLLESQDEYQGKSCKYQVYVEAVQGNADVSDPFTKIDDRHFEINNAKGMTMMQSLANQYGAGEGNLINFKLTDDIDMTGVKYSYEYMWTAFDGDNHTISNLSVDGWRAGLLGYAGGCVIENVTLKNFNVTGAQAGIIAGTADGTLARNVTIAGTNKVTYEAKRQGGETAKYEEWNGIGALFGLSYYTTVENVTIADGATVTIDYNDMITDVACVYNDNNAGGVFANNYTGNVAVNGTINKVSSFDYIAKFSAKVNGETKTYLMSKGMYESIVMHNGAGYTDKVQSAAVYTASDLKVVNELWQDQVMVANRTNQVYAEIHLKNNVDFGGQTWLPLGMNVDFYGNGYTISNIVMGKNANGQSGLYGYAGNATISRLTLNNVTAEGSQAGAFAGNITNNKITGCALTGNVTINWIATADEYNGIGAVAGVSSSENSIVLVDISAANITLNKTGITYPAGFAENDNIIGVIYGGTINEVPTGTTLVTSKEEAATAFTTDGSVIIGQDLAIDDGTIVNANTNVDFMGNVLSRDTASGNPLWLAAPNKTITLNNANFESVKGSAVMQIKSDMRIVDGRFENVAAEGTNVVVNDSVFTNLAAPSTGNTGVQVYANDVTMTFNNCEFNNMPIVTNASYPEGIKLVFNNCKFTWTGDNCPGMIQIANNLKITVDLNNCEFKYETSSQYTMAKNFISFNWPETSTININGLKVTGIRNNDNIWRLVSSNNKVTVNTSGVLSYTFNGQAIDFDTYLR